MDQIGDQYEVVACRVGPLDGVASHRPDPGLQARGLDAALRQRDNLGPLEHRRLDLGVPAGNGGGDRSRPAADVQQTAMCGEVIDRCQYLRRPGRQRLDPGREDFPQSWAELLRRPAAAQHGFQLGPGRVADQGQNRKTGRRSAGVRPARKVLAAAPLL